jgi:hypothetical protein
MHIYLQQVFPIKINNMSSMKSVIAIFACCSSVPSSFGFAPTVHQNAIIGNNRLSPSYNRCGFTADTRTHIRNSLIKLDSVGLEDTNDLIGDDSGAFSLKEQVSRRYHDNCNTIT